MAIFAHAHAKVSMFRCILFLSLVFLSLNAEEKTLSLIKPDTVASHHIGEIIARFEKADLHIAAMKMTKLTESQAKAFYAVHSDKPFYADLVRYMTSGPIVALVLAGPNAVAKNRELMGATDPKKAAPNTIRADFGKGLDQNAVHGSDSAENAKKEIEFFFTPQEIFE